MYKTLTEFAPEYLQCLFTQGHVHDYNLGNLEGKLSLPKPINNYLKRSFCYSGACLWNNLPQDLKSVGSIGQLKRVLVLTFSLTDDSPCINKGFTLLTLLLDKQSQLMSEKDKQQYTLQIQ